jgi:hypothetical protein
MATWIWLAVTPSHATPEFTKKEGKQCVYCHPPGDFKKLTDAGEYYKAHDHSFKGYKETKK